MQRELIDHVAARTGAGRYFNEWRDVELSAQFQVVATGLVIISDWIASNETLLPFLGGRLPEVSENAGRGRWALDRLALLPPWQPGDLPDTVDDLFAVRFQFPEGAEPRPVQRAACEAVGAMSEPGLVIIEAPMGEGKTEAALAAAEIMSRRWGAGGLQVALPTQATSDAMFDRVIQWLDTMGEANQTVGAITLSHGKARFNRLFQGLLRPGRLAEIGCDEEFGTDPQHHLEHTVVAHSWLSGRKKSQLANFVVGTIDQVLFAALKSRHLMLRHLALAGKIVLLDEVHAYDVFMNSYLKRVLTWLGAYHVPVLALSATLPAERRHRPARRIPARMDRRPITHSSRTFWAGYRATADIQLSLPPRVWMSIVGMSRHQAGRPPCRSLLSAAAQSTTSRTWPHCFRTHSLMADALLSCATLFAGFFAPRISLRVGFPMR